MIADDLFPGSLCLPRWRPCQIPDPGVATKSKSLLRGRLSESNSRGQISIINNNKLDFGHVIIIKEKYTYLYK